MLKGWQIICATNSCCAKSKRATSGLCKVLPGACGEALFLPVSPNSRAVQQVKLCLPQIHIIFYECSHWLLPWELCYCSPTTWRAAEVALSPYRFLLFHPCVLRVRLPRDAFLIQLYLRTQPNGGMLSLRVLSTGFLLLSFCRRCAGRSGVLWSRNLCWGGCLGEGYLSGTTSIYYVGSFNFSRPVVPNKAQKSTGFLQVVQMVL